jgi:ATP-dependent Lon protease
MKSQASLKEPPAESKPEQPPPPPAPALGKPPEQSEPKIPDVLPILPLRNLVLFPGTVSPLSIGRMDSIKLVEESLPQSKVIGVIAQRVAEKENPGPDDLHRVGTAALVLKLVRQSERAILLIVQGLGRFAVRKFVQTEPYLRAEVELHPTWTSTGNKEGSGGRNLRETTAKLMN